MRIGWLASAAVAALADVTTLEKVAFVMKGGTVYKADGKPVAP
ncbi:hypothetical protein [Phenylobacterium glaciei]|nr:hypothetical protein [Phenylobacterium glaciei]